MTAISTLCFGALVLACCSFAQRLGDWLNVIDHPDSTRKRHVRPTPLVGGIALMVPLLLMMGYELAANPAMTSVFVVLGLATIGFMGLGLFDDRHEVPPAVRLLISTGLCAGLLSINPDLQLMRLDLGPIAVSLGPWALPFTILCLVGLQNAVNMADGLNGLVIGLCIFWTICLLLYAPPGLTPFLSLFLVGLFILLPYNLANRLFLGDAGSYALAVSVGLLMVYTYQESVEPLPMLTVVLWLLVPVLDCLRVMISRILVNRSPLLADTNHLHHRLARSLRWPLSVLIYLAMAALPGLGAAFRPDLTTPLLLASIGVYASVIWLTRDREPWQLRPFRAPTELTSPRRRQGLSDGRLA